jgi:hypothetical protein
MQDNTDAINRCRRGLNALLKLAEARNYQLDKDGVVWCPVSVDADAPKLKADSGTSFRRFLLHLYFPDGDEAELPIGYLFFAAHVVEFKENAWLKKSFSDYASRRYLDIYKKAPEGCQPDERLFFDTYDASAKGPDDDDRLLGWLGGIDYFRIPAANADSFIYVPTATARHNSNSKIAMPRSGASNATHSANRNALRHFFYVDVGAWSSPQNPAGSGQAPFCMISPDEIALWDLLARPSSKYDLPPRRSTMVSDFLEREARDLKGSLIFYARFFGDHFATHRSGSPHRHHYPVPIPFTSEKLVFLIPDLHLHMFPHSAADNFLEPGRDGQSLAGHLAHLLQRIALYSARKPAMELYQLGDCYELWESALLLCFAMGESFTDLFTSIGIRLSLSHTLIKNFRDDLREDMKERGLHEVFRSRDRDVQALGGSTRWNDSSLKPLWQTMKETIERAQVIPDTGECLFTTDGRVRHFGQWKIIGGNHDSFVTDVTPIACGANNAIFIEHGHLRDSSNSPENMLSGVFWTGLSTALELKHAGDEGKAIEVSRRNDFLKNAADVNLKTDYGFGKPAGSGPGYYSIVATGHTHRKYVSLLREHPSFPEQYENLVVFHEDHWPRGQSARLRALANPRLLGYGLGDVAATSSPLGWLGHRIARTLVKRAAKK